jgi:hypothetical protein
MPAARFCPRCGSVLAQQAAGRLAEGREPSVGVMHPLAYVSAPKPLPPKARTIWREPLWVRFGGIVVALIGGGLMGTGNPMVSPTGLVLFAIGLIAVIVTLFA